MNRVFMRAGCKRLVFGATLVALATLLTMLFSFLGTIACAVITGMMFGAFRQWRWEVFGGSMVFPAVVLGLVQFAQANLSWPKTIKLALVCFCGFWLSYLLTWLVMLLERPRPAAAPVGTDPSRNGAAGLLQSSDGPRLESTARNGEWALHRFQGCWSCTTPDFNGEPETRELEIRDGHVVLRVRDSNGQFRTVSTAELKLDESCAAPATS